MDGVDITARSSEKSPESLTLYTQLSTELYQKKQVSVPVLPIVGAMPKNVTTFLLLLLIGICSYIFVTQLTFQYVKCDSPKKIFVAFNSSSQDRTQYIIPASRESGLRSIERYLLDGPDSKDEYKKVPPLFEENHPPQNICSTWVLKPTVPKERYFMVFFVKSAVAYRKRRDMVRNTWGAVRSINGKRFGVIFLVGKIANESHQAQLRTEHEQQGDILQSDVPDDYKMLPDKTLTAFQWVSQVANNISDYYAFTDDDCVINVALTYDYFWTNQRAFLESNAMHCAFMYSASIGPERSGKYAVSSKTYPWGRLPPFCHGGFTVLPYQQMVDIYQQAQITKRYDLHLEDVYILGILRTKLGRGNDNVKIAYADEKRGSINYYMGPFVWHVGDNADFFRAAWRVTFNLMNTVTKTFQHLGYWPSANSILALLSPDAEIPNDEDQAEFFKHHFAELSSSVASDVQNL